MRMNWAFSRWPFEGGLLWEISLGPIRYMRKTWLPGSKPVTQNASRRQGGRREDGCVVEFLSCSSTYSQVCKSVVPLAIWSSVTSRDRCNRFTIRPAIQRLRTPRKLFGKNHVRELAFSYIQARHTEWQNLTTRRNLRRRGYSHKRVRYKLGFFFHWYS